MAKRKTHELKTWPEYFRPIMSGDKTFEVRLDDRGFKVGDILDLREYHAGRWYTGNSCRVEVTYILRGGAWLPYPSGYVVMSIRAERDKRS